METKTKNKSENLKKLEELVCDLENREPNSEEYLLALKQIAELINKEKKAISRLRTPETKLKRYESICATIIGIVSTTTCIN